MITVIIKTTNFRFKPSRYFRFKPSWYFRLKPSWYFRFKPSWYFDMQGQVVRLMLVGNIFVTRDFFVIFWTS